MFLYSIFDSVLFDKKKVVPVLFCLLLCQVGSFADSIQYPTNARYVIVNPNGTLKASSTVLLDTKTGKTWQLVVDSTGVNSWQQMQYDWYKEDGTFGGVTFKPPLQLAP